MSRIHESVGRRKMKQMRRYLVLFARAPEREARDKGFAGRDAAELFAAFAEGWREAARRADARLILAAPPEDRAAWRKRLFSDGETVEIIQQGNTFGERLAGTARRVTALGGHAVVVGGDVAPSEESLAAAFDFLERGADAVLAPDDDGGVSLVGLKEEDLDLLEGVTPRRRDVFVSLLTRLTRRGKVVELVYLARDVDCRADLRSLLRAAVFPAGQQVLFLARRALATSAFRASARPAVPPSPALASPSGLRAPPIAA